MKRDDGEGGHRVPFIVYWPGHVKPGQTSDQLTSPTDVMATVAAIVGAKLPDAASEDSHNMLPALLEQAFAGGRYLSIRHGNWKLPDHKGSGGNNCNFPLLKRYVLKDIEPDAPGQLFDLAKDPGEKPMSNRSIRKLSGTQGHARCFKARRTQRAASGKHCRKNVSYRFQRRDENRRSPFAPVPPAVGLFHLPVPIHHPCPGIGGARPDLSLEKIVIAGANRLHQSPGLMEILRRRPTPAHLFLSVTSTLGNAPSSG